MTKMKKLTSVLLAAAMAASLMVPAWASMDFSEEDNLAVNLMEDNSYEAEDKLSAIGESGSKIIVVDREIAETMGKEILSYIDEEMMVFFANMTNAEVEQYTEVPRYLRAEDEPGDVLGTGLLLTNGKYNYVTYYKGNVDRNALAQSDMISMGEYDKFAEIAYNFAREKTAVCENTEARTRVGLEQADEIFAVDMQNVYSKSGAVVGYQGWTLYEKNLGTKSVNGVPMGAYSVTCVARFQPLDQYRCIDLNVELFVPVSFKLLDATELPKNGNTSVSLSNSGFSWSYSMGPCTATSTWDQQTATWRVRPTNASYGDLWMVKPGIDAVSNVKGASRGQVTATISTPTFYALGILQKDNTFSKTYSFAIG